MKKKSFIKPSGIESGYKEPINDRKIWTRPGNNDIFTHFEGIWDNFTKASHLGVKEEAEGSAN
ncbi:hypothetical protein [Larkinella knui]